MDFFKGYVETKNKKCIEKIRGRNDFKSYEQIKLLPEFAGILAEETILIDVDDFEQSEILFKIVNDLKLKCRVYKTTRGKHFLFKNTEQQTCKTHTKVAVGLTVDIKVGIKNSYEVLKFDGKEREILYDTNEYELVPKWLFPIKTKQEFLEMESGDGRNQALFNYILTLQSNDFTENESRECIELINKYIIKDSLPSSELEVIIRDESFKKPTFYKGNTFLFDKFATYMKNQYHIIKINNQLHLYEDGIYVTGQDKIESKMIEVVPSLNRAKRSEVYAYINLLIRKNLRTLDANLIAFKNGVYNIEDDSFTEFSPDYIITNKINWNYNPSAKSELAETTLKKFACNDENIETLLKEVIGYCFYRYNELGKAFILTGDKSNGKSTFLDMISYLLGQENISSLDLAELGERFKTAELFGKLANIGDDIKGDFIPDLAIFKKLVTGDRVNAERKGQDPFEFNNYSKMLFSANKIPRVKDETGAVLRRLIIVPFNAKFDKNSKDYDPYIKYKLRSDEVMEYLIMEGLKGLKNVLKNKGFTISEKIEIELQEFDEMNNPILMFIRDNDENDIKNHTTNEVYLNYTEYCRESGLNPLGKIEFSRQMCKNFGFKVSIKKIDSKTMRIFEKVTD
jgi:putative DNA primase/helicase